MAQDFNILSTSNIIREDVARHNTNYATLRSQFSGTTFPSNPSTGQPCFRTDLGQTVLGGGTTGRWYIYSGNPNAGLIGWVNPQDMGEIEAELVNARGSKLSLDQRLDIALNEDGTLRDNVAGVINQYQQLTATYVYVNTTTFKTDGNTTDIFLEDRRLKVNLDSSYFYTKVVSSSYDGGGDETTVIIADASLDNTLLSVFYHLITPEAFDENIKLIESEITINVTSNANITLTNDQCKYRRFIITDTSVILTTSRDIIFNSVEKAWFLFQNDTAQTLKVKVLGQTGVSVTAGQAVMLKNDGTDIVDSEEYADDGLLGTPNTSFSSTGARIYPDGVIRGKSSYGEYVKYPDGGLMVSSNRIYPSGNFSAGTYIWEILFPMSGISTNTPISLVAEAIGNGFDEGAETFSIFISSRIADRIEVNFTKTVTVTGYGLKSFYIGTWK